MKQANKKNEESQMEIAFPEKPPMEKQQTPATHGEEINKRFIAAQLPPGPVDPFLKIKESIGWQSFEDFDDTAPDYAEKQARKREAADKQFPASPAPDIYDAIMEELGWPSWEDFDDTAPGYVEKRSPEEIKRVQDLHPEPSPERITALQVGNAAVENAVAHIPALQESYDLRMELFSLLFEMADVLEQMPSDQRRGKADQTVLDWLVSHDLATPEDWE